MEESKGLNICSQLSPMKSPRHSNIQFVNSTGRLDLARAVWLLQSAVSSPAKFLESVIYNGVFSVFWHVLRLL